MQKQPVATPESESLIPKKDYDLLAENLHEKDLKIAYLEQELAQLKRIIFGSKSERFTGTVDSEQLALWEKGQKREEEKQEETITYTREKKEKKKPVRVELPANLPRDVQIIEPESSVEGARKIGEVVTEILEYTPGKLFVKRYVRPKYVQGEQILIGELPSLPIPQGNAGPSLLSQLLISKFVDHLPFYRQVQQFKREGIKIAESTISGWFGTTCRLMEPLYKVLKEKVQQSGYVQADETPIKVKSSLKEGAMDKGFHWVYHAPREQLVCFDYRHGRGREGPADFLQGFTGTLQTDGYGVYEKFGENPRITLLGCMAHARRKFEQALDNDPERAGHAMELIQSLYAIEREIKQLTYEERHAARMEHALPVIKQMESWLENQKGQVLPKSAIGKAIHYTYGQWHKLKKYMEDGLVEIDNNLVENTIRPVALGRKNYLFAGSHEAARWAAIMYSFFATCKLKEVEPRQWLTDVLTKIQDTKLSELETLLPVKK
ncbi:MAG: IS66 family transposase [Cyclobacteriaceae bacterium]|nr:IS66 family transposase [Cyclobacteriaceae bacterium]